MEKENPLLGFIRSDAPLRGLKSKWKPTENSRNRCSSLPRAGITRDLDRMTARSGCRDIVATSVKSSVYTSACSTGKRMRAGTITGFCRAASPREESPLSRTYIHTLRGGNGNPRNSYSRARARATKGRSVCLFQLLARPDFSSFDAGPNFSTFRLNGMDSCVRASSMVIGFASGKNILNMCAGRIRADWPTFWLNFLKLLRISCTGWRCLINKIAPFRGRKKNFRELDAQSYSARVHLVMIRVCDKGKILRSNYINSIAKIKKEADV